ncbi:hypothetical protein PanWU01x14_153400, partial [Parasponia andersonii]
MLVKLEVDSVLQTILDRILGYTLLGNFVLILSPSSLELRIDSCPSLVADQEACLEFYDNLPSRQNLIVISRD